MGFPYRYIEDWERAAFKTPTPMGIMIPTPRTAAEVFSDFKGRRASFRTALTVDFERFHQQCDPAVYFWLHGCFTEKEHPCLFAFPNETWQVKPPTEMVPPELPEPVLGINFSRDLIQEKDWLTNVSLHSDSWLLSVAFHMSTDYGFDKSERQRLFKMINDLPTIVEVVSGNAMEEIDEEGATLCGVCGAYYGIDGFWICCDICDEWFHGTCVKITAAESEYIEHYKCPTCSNEGAKV